MDNNIQKKRVIRSQKQIRKRWKIARLFCIIGIILLIAGGFLGFFMNRKPYGDIIGDTYKFQAVVSDVHEQMDVVIQESGSISTFMYHLVIEYEYDDIKRELILNESYLTKNVAADYIGESRDIVIDTGTFKELERNEFRYEFILMMILGFVVLIGALMFMYRFTSEYKMFGKGV